MMPEGWKESIIGDICKLGRGRVISRIEIENNPGVYPVFSSQTTNDGIFGYLNSFDFDGEYITWTTDGANAGAVFYRNGRFNCTNVCGTIQKKNNDIDLMFLAYQLGRFTDKHVSRNLANPKLMNGVMAEILVPLPPLPEQRRIAAILGTWDRAIRLTEQRIAAQQQRKRALMQHLLTGRRRFREFAGSEWNYLKLEEFLIPEQRKVPKPSTTYPAIGVRSHGKGTFQKDDVDPEDVSMDTLYRVRHNDLIVSITFAWEGAIALVRETDDGCLVSHRFPTYVFDAQKVIPEFFRYIILTKWFVFQLGLISPGGAGRNRVLSKNDFLKLKVLLPSLEEQQRIAAVLQAADSELALLAARRAALQRQKHGLMQQLLTGRVRVPLPETHTKGADDGSNSPLP
jgi:type I restriction enzyme S subunit